MTLRHKALAQRIRLEIDALEQTTSAIDRHWQRAKTSGADQDAFLNSVALNLHSFYNGTELLAFADFLEGLENHE